MTGQAAFGKPPPPVMVRHASLPPSLRMPASCSNLDHGGAGAGAVFFQVAKKPNLPK